METSCGKLVLFQDLPVMLKAPTQKRGRTPGAQTSIRFFLFVVLTLNFFPVIHAAPPPGYYLVWSDEFNSPTLDRTKWDFWLLGHRRDAVNVTNAISLDGSHLVITTYTSNNMHYTGFVATDQTFRTRYGYWESRLRWNDTNGMWSAFWLQSPEMITRNPEPNLSGSEIDIAEHRFVDESKRDIANQIQVNIHWNGYGHGSHSSGSGNVASRLADDFHTYGFLWTSNSYSFLVDDEKVYNGGPAPVSHSTAWTIFSSEVDDSSTLWASRIPSEGYGSLTDSTTKLLVDYVRYYAPTNVLFWTGIESADWSHPANLVANKLPGPSCDLIFGSLSKNPKVNLDTDCSINGLVVLETAEPVFINGAHPLVLGTGGIDLSAANHPLQIEAPTRLSASQAWCISKRADILTLRGPISGNETLTKTGEGSLTLSNARDFSGNLIVAAGTLAARSPITLGGSLTFSSNSVALIEINNQGGNPRLNISGELICNGTLLVTASNMSFSAGDRFKLFEAASYSGVFQKTELPSLPAGLHWNTQNLTDGFLSVATEK